MSRHDILASTVKRKEKKKKVFYFSKCTPRGEQKKSYCIFHSLGDSIMFYVWYRYK